MATSTSNGVRIPQSINRWRELARENGVLGTINQLGSQAKVKSASKFDFKHFLGLRVIYKLEEKPGESSLPTEITSQFPVPSSLALDKTSFWNDYLTEIRNFTGNRAGASASCIPQALGPLVNVWQYQKHVILGDDKYADMSKVSKVSPIAHRTRAQQNLLRALTLATPTPAPKPQPLQEMMGGESLYAKLAKVRLGDQSDEDSPDEHMDDETVEDLDLDTLDDPLDNDFNTPGVNATDRLIKDEQTVNVFLLAFLSAITATTVPFHTRWLAERSAMVYQKEVRYVARTDGHLRGGAGDTYSLIEVKPRRRIAGEPSIRIQESAQIAAWLTQNKKESHNPYQNCRIFLLSQDKDQIFVTFPSWGKAYGKEKQGKMTKQGEKEIIDINKLNEDDFLWMEECGPFSLRSADDMAQVANFLHGYTIHVSGIPDPSEK